MGFNTEEFLTAKFEPRTDDVPVGDSALQGFFDKDEKPVWKVRGLDGKEYGRAEVAAEANKNIEALVDALFGKSDKKKAEAIKKMMIGGDTPQDIAKRIAMLKIGSVDPEVNDELALKVCTVAPIEFLIITNKIIKLTGAGHVPGKPPPSGKTKESKQP